MKLQKLFLLVCFFCILGFAIFSRLYGNNWDQDQHLDPDERFLTMVSTSLTWPSSVSEYLDTQTSTLNPHNTGFDFYVYGTWPVIFVKKIGELVGKKDYGTIPSVGRTLSGMADLTTLLFVFLIGKRLMNMYIEKNGSQQKRTHAQIAGLFSMTAYALMTLPIQLSHFFTADPYLTLFLTVSLYLLLFAPHPIRGILLGVTFGLTLSAKISGIIFFPVIGIYGILHLFEKTFSFHRETQSNSLITKIQSLNIHTKRLTINFTQLLIFYLLFTVFFYLSFRILMPYFFSNSSLISFTPNPHLLENWKTLQGFNDPKAWFPPSVQWINQTPLIAPVLNILFWGLGIPLAVLSIISVGWALFQTKQHSILLFPLLSIILVVFYQGIQFATPMRYFWPIYPPLAALIGVFLYIIYRRNNSYKFYFATGIFFFLLLVWPLSYLTIYSRHVTRVTASEWIYQNIPPGSSVSHEHWDDPLPLNLPNYALNQYEGVELPMYYEDTPQKWTEIIPKLDALDYIILSSNRVYGSITSAPERYPQTTEFYKRLFSGELGFEKVAEFTSRPTIPFPISVCIRMPFFHYGDIDSSSLQECKGIQFIDDYAEESFTVYDHPKVTIFKKTNQYSSPMFLLNDSLP